MRQHVFEQNVRHKNVDDIVGTTPHQRGVMTDDKRGLTETMSLVPKICYHLREVDGEKEEEEKKKEKEERYEAKNKVQETLTKLKTPLSRPNKTKFCRF